MTRGLSIVSLLLLVAAIAVVALMLRREQRGAPEPSPAKPPLRAAVDPQAAEPSLTLPEWWNRDDPLPQKRTNCMRCHLTAGRELTRPVRDFARSVHDLAGYSCNDCH